jgi:hypothetical protein
MHELDGLEIGDHWSSSSGYVPFYNSTNDSHTKFYGSGSGGRRRSGVGNSPRNDDDAEGDDDDDDDNDDNDDKENSKKIETWFAGGERRCILSRGLIPEINSNNRAI